jgi:hypothetical protein
MSTKLRLKSSKGKQHGAKGVSFRNIARELQKEATNPTVNLSDPRALLHLIADALMREGKRVQTIKR